MGILTINTDSPGQSGVYPRRVKIITTDNLATVTTAGYLNPVTLEGYAIANTDVLWIWYGATGSPGVPPAVTSAGTFGTFLPSISNGVITLSSWANPGDVLLPVTNNTIAVFNGTSGQIKSNSSSSPTLATNYGSIAAGASGVLGGFISYPATVASGSITIAAINNAGGNFGTTITNATSYAQNQAITIPDSGATTANFLLSKSAGIQHITSGSLEVDAGSLISGIGTGGFVGKVQLFPTTASTGSLTWQATPNSGNTATVFTTAAYGQASTITYPDPANTTANGVLAAAALVNGNLIKASGTAGLIADSGIAAVNIQTSALTSPDAISDLIWYDVTATAAALATAGQVNIQVSSGAKQYKVRNVIVNYAAAGLSGGGGNRLLAITDGTTVYNNAGITAALLGTPINTIWGGTGNPLAGTVAQNTSTVAAANLFLQYTGGTTDYATGQIVISVLVQRVA